MGQYFDDAFAKAEIVRVSHLMYERGMVAANDGNVSCRVAENAFWCTPTLWSKGEVTEEMLVKLDLDCNVLEGGYKPSSESKMHARVYRESGEAAAVCHAHPVFATAFAIARKPINFSFYPEALIALGEVPVAEYATTGTFAVPDSIAPFIHDHCAALLANHGAITWGRDPREAWYRLEAVENYAKISFYAFQIPGGPHDLDEKEQERLKQIASSIPGFAPGGRA